MADKLSAGGRGGAKELTLGEVLDGGTVGKEGGFELKSQLAVGLIQGVCTFHCHPRWGILFRLIRDKQPPKLGRETPASEIILALHIPDSNCN